MNSSASLFSLKDWQRAALARMLVGDRSPDDEASGADADAGDDGAPGAGARGAGAGSAWSDDWKVLVLDADTRGIVAPLLSVPELRSLAVTLHLAIDAPRDALPDVSAVYFVRPTGANVAAIAADAAAGRYRDAHVHFASPVQRDVLESFARACVEQGCVARVRRVWDQHLAFVALEPRLFTLNLRNGFASYRSPRAANENDGAAVLDFARQTAQGLLSVFGTVGSVPVIVFAQGGPAELVARALDELVRDHLGSANLGAFGAAAGGVGAQPVPLPGRRRPEPLGFGAGARPALVLLDRDVDVTAPLAHCSTYQALVDDCFGPITLNRVVVPDTGALGADAKGGASAEDSAGAGGALGVLASAMSSLWGAGAGGAAGKKAGGRTLFLDPDTDAFWRVHACDDYQRAVESQESEAKDAAAHEEELRRSRARLGASAVASEAAAAATLALGSNGPDASAATLLSAINSMPELLKRKKMLEVHAGVLTALFRIALEGRGMNRFAEAEAPAQQFGEPLDRAVVLQICAEGGEGRVFDDRLRLAAIHLLTCPLVTAASGGGGGVGVAGGGAAAAGAPGSSASAAAGFSGASSPAAILDSEADALLTALKASLSSPITESANAAASGAAAAAAAPPLSAAAVAQQQRANAVLAYVKHLRSTAAAAAGGFGGASFGNGGGGGFSLSQAVGVGGGAGGALLDAGGRLFGNIFSAASQVARSAARGAARLVAGEARMPVTRIVQAVCEGRPSLAQGSGANVESFGVLDPRMGVGRPGGGAQAQAQLYGSYVAAANAAASAAAAGGPAAGGAAMGAAAAAQAVGFRNAFVFVVGGGCYSEAHDVFRYANAAEPRRCVVYGSTDLVNGKTFVDQLEGLGNEISGGR